MTKKKSLASDVISSSTLLFVARVLQKSLGIISLIILSRILDVEDYAIIAICTFVIYFAEMLSNLGSESFIMRKTHVTDDDLNTAFTLDLISKCAIWFLIVISIPIMISFLDRYDEIGLALLASSSIVLLNAFTNPGVFLLNRKFEYKGIFFLQLLQKFISFTVIISLAVIYESYWALIIGDICFALIYLLGSYKISTFRPKIGFVGLKVQWDFSKWVIISSIIGYLRAQLDILIVSKLYTPIELGRYHLIKQVTMIPASDALEPAILPLMTSFAKVKKGKEKIAYQFNLTFFVTLLFFTPLCLYIWKNAYLIVDVILGEKWREAAPLMSTFAAMLFSYAINLLLTPIFVVKNKMKQLFYYNFLSFIVVAFSLFTLFLLEYSLEEFTYFRTLAAFCPVIICLVYIFNILSIDTVKVILLITPIIIGSVLSLLIVSYIPNKLFEVNFFNLTYHFVLYCFLSYSIIYILASFQQSQYAEIGHVKSLIRGLILKIKG